MKVSIIVPVYNVEKYLEECLDSLLKQTIKEREIIIINDGSTDKSLEIAINYSKNNKDIKIFSKENGGLSSARNYGIEMSRGEYIMFIDSDDLLIDKSCIEDFYKIAKENECDIVKGKYLILDEKTGEKIKGTSFEKFSLLNKCVCSREYFNHCIEEKKYEVTAVLGLYRKFFLDYYNIRFMENVKMEDHDFNLKLLLSFKGKVFQTDREFYLYRKREGSITTSPNKDGIKDIIKIYKKLKRFIETTELDKRTKKNSKKAISALVYQATSIYGRLKENEQLLVDKYFEKDILKFCLKNTIDLHQKIKLYIFLYARNLVRYIYSYKLRKTIIKS